jgi:HNH endonuclease.
MESQNLEIKAGKACRKCGEVKGLDWFSPDKRNLDGKQGVCRKCFNQCSREFNRTPEGKAYNKERNQKSVVKAQKKKYSQRPEVKARKKEWTQKPETKIRRNKRQKERLSFDLNFKLAANLRSGLWRVIRNKQKAGSAVDDLGCSLDFLRAYLEAHFNPGMTWENWGKGPGKWNIDHIVPLAWFDLTNREQLLSACHYTNLQPLWSEENLSKGDKY